MNYPEQLNRYVSFIQKYEDWKNEDVMEIIREIGNERHLHGDMIVFLDVLEDLLRVERYMKVHKILRKRIPYKDPSIFPGNYIKRNEPK